MSVQSEKRPWGEFTILSENKDYKVKSIVVNPQHQFSYQSHSKRSEHWVIISGEAEVILDDALRVLKAGEHVFIPQSSKHRLRNSGQVPVVFIEVQTGTYFGEDDIVRYQDDYNRV